MNTSTVWVRARRGLIVPFDAETATAPGAGVLRLYGAGVRSPDHPGDAPIEVPFNRFVRGRLRAGDLEKATPAAKAAAPATTSKKES
jgi:hypothetical protein